MYTSLNNFIFITKCKKNDGNTSGLRFRLLTRLPDEFITCINQGNYRSTRAKGDNSTYTWFFFGLISSKALLN